MTQAIASNTKYETDVILGDVDRRRPLEGKLLVECNKNLHESHSAVHAIELETSQGDMQPPRFKSTAQ